MKIEEYVFIKPFSDYANERGLIFRYKSEDTSDIYIYFSDAQNREALIWGSINKEDGRLNRLVLKAMPYIIYNFLLPWVRVEVILEEFPFLIIKQDILYVPNEL